MQAAGGGEFGAGVKNAGCNEGADEVAVARGFGMEDFIEPEAAESAEDSGDMTVRKRADNLDGFAWCDEGFAFQDTAKKFYLRGGPGGEIGDGPFADCGAVAKRLAEEYGRGRIAVGDPFHVHGNRRSH